MTKAECKAALIDAQTMNGDPEAAHARADEILCEYLRTNLDEDLVAEYEKITRWCA